MSRKLGIVIPGACREWISTTAALYSTDNKRCSPFLQFSESQLRTSGKWATAFRVHDLAFSLAQGRFKETLRASNRSF